MAIAPILFTTGGALIDNIVSGNGDVVRGQAGGNALYSAAGAALWTGNVGVVANLPDNYSQAIVEALAAGSLNVDGLRRTSDAVDLEEWFFYAADGERRDQLHASAAEADDFGMRSGPAVTEAVLRFAAHLASRRPSGLDYGAFRRRHPILPEQVPDAFWRARAAHLAPNPPEAQLALAAAAREKRLLITADPGHFAAEFTPALRDRLLPLLDGFMPSRVEVGRLYPGLGLAEAAAEMAAATRSFAAVKLGPDGALLALKGATPMHLPAATVAAADLTGAGDAFCGGMIAALALGEVPLQAAAHAMAAASLAVETRGPVALLCVLRTKAAERLQALASSDRPSRFREPSDA